MIVTHRRATVAGKAAREAADHLRGSRRSPSPLATSINVAHRASPVRVRHASGPVVGTRTAATLDPTWQPPKEDELADAVEALGSEPGDTREKSA